MRFIVYIAIMLLVCSCKCRQLPQTNTVRTVTITEVVKDTIFVTEPDSTHYKAYLKCVEGKVVIDKVDPKNTTGSKTLNTPKVKVTDNVLEVDCVTKAYELFHQWKESHFNEVITTTIREPYPVERELTFFQKVFIWLGKLFGILIIAFIIWLIIKFKNPFKIF